MNDLKPCPFCGGEIFVDLLRTSINCVETEVHCKCCHMSFAYRQEFAHSRKERVAMDDSFAEVWNKRVPQTTVNQFGENCTHISNCGTLNLNL